MKLLSPVVIAIGCWGWASAAEAKVLWVGDFETGDLTQWDSTNLIKTGDRLNFVIEGDTVAEGTKAAKIELQKDIIFEPFNQSRVEVKHNGLHTMNNEESYYVWSFMVPKDAEIRSNIGYWESLSSSLNTMTFFIEPAPAGGTNVKFGTGDLGKTVRWTALLELNKWHRMAIHNKWSQGADGTVDVWYDGVQVVTAAMAPKRDANKLFFQMGLHRSDPSPPIQDIYIDAAMEADSLADILAPLPGATGMGGSGGSGGASGAAGMPSSSGAGGLNGGSGGELSGDSGGAPSAGAGGMANGGAPGAAGTPATVGGGGQAGTSSPPLTTTNSGANDSGGCSMHEQNGPGAREVWPLLGLLLLGRRRRAASRAAR